MACRSMPPSLRCTTHVPSGTRQCQLPQAASSFVYHARASNDAADTGSGTATTRLRAPVLRASAGIHVATHCRTIIVPLSPGLSLMFTAAEASSALLRGKTV